MVRISVNGKRVKTLKTAKGKDLNKVIKEIKTPIDDQDTEETLTNKGWKEYIMKGEIIGKDKQKNKTGIYAGSYYWVLDVKIETRQFVRVEKIFVGKEKLVDPQVWLEVESNNWFSKSYLFRCTKTPMKYSNCYWLLDWKTHN